MVEDLADSFFDKTKNMKKIFVLFFLFIFSLQSFAQKRQSDQEYKRKVCIGLNFNTIGGILGGGFFRISRAISPRMYHTFGLDVLSIRHQKEQVATNFDGETFVPGKSNSVFFIRPQYGREIILFKRAADQGVQVNLLVNASPTIGVLIPYMIQYRYPTGQPKIEQYSPEKHPSFDAIQRKASQVEFLGNSQFVFGASGKVSLAFEFGNFRNNALGFEVGMAVDAMSQKIIMMPLTTNDQVFVSGFINLFYSIRN